MTRVKLTLNLNGLDASGKKLFANKILMAMTGNASLPNPSPALPVLQAAIADLDTALVAPNPSTVIVKAKVVYLEKVLMALKTHVELVCNDDEEIAAGSGFELKKPSLRKPKVFNATQGSLTGTVNLECPYLPGGAYIWEMIADPINENTWQNIGFTNTTGMVAGGLVSGNKYWFRARAVVKDAVQPYTDPHMVHVV